MLMLIKKTRTQTSIKTFKIVKCLPIVKWISCDILRYWSLYRVRFDHLKSHAIILNKFKNV